MTRERRVFNLYPVEQRTAQNNRETSVLDDVMFEPEQADFLNGFIGDISVLTAEDLARVPQIFEVTPERQKNQLSIGVNFINPATNVRDAGAYFTDLVNQIAANGGIVTDQNRIFQTNFYAWTPPIEYDKHINFSRYRWTGDGTADVNGEYVTKEAAHSKTTIYENDGASFLKRDAVVVNGLPAVGPVGTYVEDGSTVDRFIYISDGAVWNLVDFDLFDVIPTDVSVFLVGDTVYITRTGPDFNRPLVWQYSEPAGRWIARPGPVLFRST